MSNDGIKWHAHASVEKWNADQLSWISQNTGMPLTRVEQLSGNSLRAILAPEEVVEAPGNLLTYTGLAYVLSAMTAVTTTIAAVQLSNGFLPVAVGDGGGSVPTAGVTDSDLTASTNKYYNPIDATYPAVGAAGASAGVLTIQSTFTSGVANYAWNEWALFGSTALFSTGQASKPASAVMINHKGTALGTKSSGNVWTLAATITFS